VTRMSPCRSSAKRAEGDFMSSTHSVLGDSKAGDHEHRCTVPLVTEDSLGQALSSQNTASLCIVSN